MAIANADGSIVLTTKVDQSGLKKGMATIKSETASTQKGVSSLSKAVGKLGVVIAAAFAVKNIIQFSNEVGKLATKSEASVQRLIDIYGSASDAVGDFIDYNAQALGLSKTAAASYASVYGNLFSVWADQRTNAILTTKYLNMTAVVASKTGRTVEDVQERIRSGLLGNTEAIEDLGVFVNIKTIEMTDAFQRMANGKSWEQLDAYTQQQIRSMAILEQATAKYGDQVADTSATIRNKYKAAYEDFQNSWGQIVNTVLIPVLETLTEIFNVATYGLNMLSGRSGKVLENIEGTTENSASTVENQEDLNAELKETEKQTKKVLAGFDEINIISDGISENIGDSTQGNLFGDLDVNVSMGEAPDTSALDAIFQRISEISKVFETKFWEGFATANFSIPEKSLKSFSEQLQKTYNEALGITQGVVSNVAFEFGSITGSVSELGAAIIKLWLDTASSYLDENSSFLTEKLSEMLDTREQSIEAASTTIGTWVSIISEALNGEKGSQLTSNIASIFFNSQAEIFAIGAKIGADFATNLAEAINENQPQISQAVQGIVGALAGISESANDIVQQVTESASSIYDSGISPFIESTGTSLSEWARTFLSAWNEDINPTLTELSNGFDEAFESHISPAIRNVTGFIERLIQIIKFLWEKTLSPFINFVIKTAMPSISSGLANIKEIFLAVVKVVSDAVSGLFTSINGLVDFITGVFQGDWEKAWDGIVSYFKGAWKIIESVFVNGIFSPIKNIAQNWRVEISEWWENDVRPWFTSAKWNELFGNISKSVSAFFESANGFKNVWGGKISEWWNNNVAPWFTADKWKEIFFEIGKSLGVAIAGTGGFIKTWNNNIKSWWDNNVAPWFTVEKWADLFQNTANAVDDFFTSEDGFVQTWANRIEEWWDDEVTPWFTKEKWEELGENIKKGIVDGFNGAVNGIRGIINQIIDGFQGLVNGVVGMLNSLASGYNTVADVVPGVPSVPTIPMIDLSKYKLPMLAQGAVIPPNREFLAVLGDQKRGTNIETPLATMVEAFQMALDSRGGYGGSNIEVVLELDGREFGRAVVEQGNRENRRIGTRLVIA